MTILLPKYFSSLAGLSITLFLILLNIAVIGLIIFGLKEIINNFKCKR